jgi:hypothetical protein
MPLEKAMAGQKPSQFAQALLSLIVLEEMK